MSLQNLLAIQRPQIFEATPGGVQHLLARPNPMHWTYLPC